MIVLKRSKERIIIIFSSALLITSIMSLNILYSYATPDFNIHNIVRIIIILAVGAVGSLTLGVLRLKWDKLGTIIRILFGISIFLLILWATPKQYRNLNVKLENQKRIFFMAYSRKPSTLAQIQNFDVGIIYRMTYISSNNSPKQAVIQLEKVQINFESSIKAEKEKYVNLGDGVLTDLPVDAEKTIIKRNSLLTHETLFITEENTHRWGDFIKNINSYKGNLNITFTAIVDNKEVKSQCVFNPEIKRKTLAKKNGQFDPKIKSLTIDCNDLN